MFTKFKTALKHSDKITLILKGDDSSLTIAIFSDPKENEVKVQPITIKGTYEEVAAEFDKALEMVFEKNTDILSNAKIIAEGVKKASEAQSKKAEIKTTAKKAQSTATAKTKTDDLFAKDEPEEVEEDEEDATLDKEITQAITTIERKEMKEKLVALDKQEEQEELF